MDQYQDSLKMLMEKRLKAARHELEVDIERLKGLSPLDRLRTGYSYVADDKGKNVRSTSDVKIGDELSVYVSDGLIKTSVTGTGKVGFLSGRED
jgi:exodeoxyribonuclease VII large subunit